MEMIMPTPKVSPRTNTPDHKVESTAVGVDIGTPGCHVRFFAEHVTVTDKPKTPDSPLIPILNATNASFTNN